MVQINLNRWWLFHSISWGPVILSGSGAARETLHFCPPNIRGLLNYFIFDALFFFLYFQIIIIFIKGKFPLVRLYPFLGVGSSAFTILLILLLGIQSQVWQLNKAPAFTPKFDNWIKPRHSLPSLTIIVQYHSNI